MWISSKIVTEMQRSLEASLRNNVEVSKALAYAASEIARLEKYEAIANALKKQLKAYESTWIKIRCPHCLKDIDLHTMKRN